MHQVEPDLPVIQAIDPFIPKEVRVGNNGDTA
jgi:hypothetical protein